MTGNKEFRSEKKKKTTSMTFLFYQRILLQFVLAYGDLCTTVDNVPKLHHNMLDGQDMIYFWTLHSLLHYCCPLPTIQTNLSLLFILLNTFPVWLLFNNLLSYRSDILKMVTLIEDASLLFHNELQRGLATQQLFIQ